MAKSQVFFFTGDNRFALEQELRRWEQEFTAKHGPDNILRKAGAKMTLRELLDDVSIAPFLAEKRLIVVDGMPKFKKPEIDTLMSQIHPSTILVFLDAKTASKAAAAKELADIATVKTFTSVKGAKLQQWVQDRIRQEGSTMTSAVADRLIQLLQGDQQFLEQEIVKLSIARKGQPVTEEDVDKHVLPLEGVPWGITDALIAGNPKRAVLEARRLHQSGIEAPMLWNMLLTFVRQVTVVSAAAEAGDTGPDLAARTGIHPFALHNILPYARKVKTTQMRPIVDRAVSIDRDLKTGGLKMSDDSSEELLGAIDSVLLRFP